MATKIQINSKKYCTFGGIFYVQDVFNRTLSDVIDNFLGLRGSTPRAYRYSELMSALFCNYLCGGDVLEDLNTRFRSEIGRPNGRIPSADVVGDSLRSLAVENVTHTSKTGREFHFNFAKRMNQLLLKCLLATGQLKKGMTIDVDFDHVFLPCEKKDATFSYKQKYGYFPGVLMSGGLILGIVMCDGNNNVRFHQEDLLEHFFSLLEDEGISIHTFRADCGSYAKPIVDTISKHCEYFYLRASNCKHRYDTFANSRSWKKACINDELCEVDSFPFDDFGEDRHFRLVVQRTEKSVVVNPNEPLLFEQEKAYEYRCILTNDVIPCEYTAIRNYNNRGTCEKNFDIQNNDFGWAHMPFSFMNENVVFLIVSAMLKNFYLHILALLPEQRFHGMCRTTRLKGFLTKFICVASRWVLRGRTHILNLYTDQPYDLVFTG